MEFIRSNILADHTAATETKTIDLPINPLSHLLINLSVLNATDEATLAEIIAFINKVSVTHYGKTILELESEDLFALNCFIYGAAPVLTNNIATDNHCRELTLVVPFGRKICDTKECFPATRKGELQLTLDTTVPATSCDGGVINIEAVELIGANPSHYMKTRLMNVSAPGSTGDNDIELPIGNKILGILLYSTTVPGTSSHTYGIDEARVLVDNKELGYVSSHANCMKGDAIFHFQTLPRDIAAFGSILPTNYFLMDYDPDKSGNWALETEGKSSVKVRLTMGVDEASKIIPIELVAV